MREKVFYGWVIVTACFVMTTYNSWIFVYGWSGFVNPIIGTFGWSLTQISLAASLRGMETGVFNPMWGVAVDRWSPKKLALWGVVAEGMGMLILSQTRNLAMYYAGFIVVGMGSTLITSVLPVTIISRWFKKNIGKANGVFYTGTGLGGVAVPILISLIDKFSWQTTLFWVSISFLVICLPLSLLYRSRPSDYGMVPDGKVSDAGSGKKSSSRDFGTSVKNAVKSRAFWHLGLVTVSQYAMMQIINFYMIPYLTTIGLSRGIAGTIVMLYTLASVIVRVPLGMLADIYRKNLIIAVTVGFMGSGLVILLLTGSVAASLGMAVAFAIVYGLGLGGVSALRPVIQAEYFGTKNFGAIFGVISIFTTVAQVTSAPLAGFMIDNYHNYNTVWIILIALAVLGVLLLLTIPKPQIMKAALVAEPIKITDFK